MKKIGWILILVIWMVLVIVGNAQEMEEGYPEIRENDLFAQAAVLMDARSGRVLYGKNEEQILAMASTTKIMTCIVALENAELTEIAEVSAYASGMPKVKLGIQKGERYRLGDLLYSLMLESHNDAAVAIAEHIGKKFLQEEVQDKGVAEFSDEESKQAVAAFATLMNEKAKNLGCRNTWFITPNGLDAQENVLQENGEYLEKFHSTTAEELALIMSYCILESPKAQQFLEITQTRNYTISGENGRVFSCSNHNAFLNMMAGAISGKTGFTNRAGYCYVGALEDKGRIFVVALLACGWPNNKNYKWADTRKLMTYGAENYYYRSFLDEGTVFDKKWLEPIPVLGGQSEVLGEVPYVQVEVCTQDEDICGKADLVGVSEGNHDGDKDSKEQSRAQLPGLLMKAGEEIVVQYEQEKQLNAPVKKGAVVGKVCYIVDDKVYRTEEIVTKEGVERIDWSWCLWQILGRFLFWEQYVVQ